MNHSKGTRHILRVRERGRTEVSFVSPIVACMIAVESRRRRDLVFEFVGDAAQYASLVGLRDVVEGRDPGARAGRLAGRTYSPLARLRDHSEVEGATDTLADCLERHLRHLDSAAVNEISRIVGELHDNIASHARGEGYSALQVYESPLRVEFAVVDGGVGLLRNARSSDDRVDSHEAAIYWCFQKGNTSAAPPEPMAQRLPDDGPNPYPPSVPTQRDWNHHVGEGLSQLATLVHDFGGDLWIVTGDAELAITSDGTESYARSRLDWSGVGFEVCLPVRAGARGPDTVDDSFAERYGL